VSAMTETEWLNCTDPDPMLEYLRNKASDRKLRLFACACARGIWDLLEDERPRQAVQVAERYADGLAIEQDLSAASDRAWEAIDANRAEANYAARATVESFAYAAAEDAAHAASQENGSAALKAHCALLRDIFGNPLRVATIDPSWQTREIVTFAQTVYEQRAFAKIPMLGDALKQGGCTNPDILAHCHQPAVHVPGCWVVDLVLG